MTNYDELVKAVEEHDSYYELLDDLSDEQVKKIANIMALTFTNPASLVCPEDKIHKIVEKHYADVVRDKMIEDKEFFRSACEKSFNLDLWKLNCVDCVKN